MIKLKLKDGVSARSSLPYPPLKLLRVSAQVCIKRHAV